MATNFFDQFDKPTAARAIGGIVVKEVDPKRSTEADQAAATLRETQARAALANQTAADQARKAHADADKAVDDAKIAHQNAEGQAALAPNSDVHGADYLKTLPAGVAATVKAVALGNVMLPANALKVPYWQQVLQHTLNYDPEFNAADFNTRARTRQDFATGKMGLNITALNTALGHAGQLESDVGALGNYPGWIGGNIINPIKNWWEGKSDPAVTNFQNDARAYGGEKTAVFANGAGGEGERAEAAASIPINGTPDQQMGVLSHDAALFKSRVDSLNDQYKRGMGHTADITDLLGPHAREVYQSLLPQTAGGNVIGGIPMAGASPGGPASPDGGSAPGGDGSGGGGGGLSIATGATRNVDLKHVNAVIDSMVRSGATAADIGKAVQPYGFGAPSADDVQNAQDYLSGSGKYAGHPHSNYTGSFGGLTATVSTTKLQQMAGGSTGALAAGAAEGAAAGALPAIAGGVSYLEGNGYGAGRDQFKVSQALMQDAHPAASLIGNLAGGALTMGGLEAGAARAGFGKFAAPAAEAAYGGVSGYNQDGVTGAVTGAIGAPIVGTIGRRVLAPIVRPITTAIGGVVGGIADRAGVSIPGTSAPVAAPSAADKTVLAAAQKAGIPNIQQSLSEAAQLGVPMSLADTSPQLRSLAGAAVRRSPNAAEVAENALIPRARGQIDRLQSAVTSTLGPVSNVPQLSADLTAQARTAAAPLYEQAYSAPAIGSPELDSLLQTPFGQTALQRARTIAANERRDPQALGFALGDDGNVSLTPVAADQYGQLAAVRSARDDLQQQLASEQRKYSGGGSGDPAKIAGLRDQLASANQQLEDAHMSLNSAPTAGVAQTSRNIRRRPSIT